MNKLTNVKSKDDFARLLGFSNSRFMNYVLYVLRTEELYETFTIPKKSGGERTINAPKKELKILQKKLANLLWDCYIEDLESESKVKNKKIPNLSHAYEKNKSIITNAKLHRNKKYVLNIDLEDFFDSFNFGRVRGFFIKDRNFCVSSDVATVIAQIACYKGKLPQGAPSSPIITNLIARILDYRIVKIAKKYRFTYSRYADDMTFSTNRKLASNKLRTIKELDKFLAELEKVIVASGFKINNKKTRLSNNMQRQEVTGLVVNKKINAKREYIKNTRAMAHKLYMDKEFEIDGREGTINQLIGRFAFVQQIDQFNNYLSYKKSLIKNNFDAQKYLIGKDSGKKSESKYYWKYIFSNRDLRKDLYYNSRHDTYNLPEGFYTLGKEEKKMYMSLFNSREKEYKKFLFYRYFYGNDKPIIVTEGKTDSRYIKAALKKLYYKYPELIEKNGSDFVFKIEFLKHTNTIEYLFNVPEGGSGFEYWYRYFSDKKRFQMSEVEKVIYPNYIEYFKKLTNRTPDNPTIFLFDNERKGPLNNFANFAKDLAISTNNFNQIRYSSFDRIIKKDSLYVMATPLIPKINNGVFSDIEDLLLVRNSTPILRGKQFSKHGGSNHYGKDIFSKHVLKNYLQYDFTEFIPLLDGVKNNIKDYYQKSNNRKK